MRRWLLWFAVPPGLVVGLWLLTFARLVPVDDIVGAATVLLWGWVALTVVALPVAVIRWLVYGGRSTRRAAG